MRFNFVLFVKRKWNDRLYFKHSEINRLIESGVSKEKYGDQRVDWASRAKVLTSFGVQKRVTGIKTMAEAQMTEKAVI